jgi:methylenetetrahydrofolate--tRNA-(uracil-5-)-methyltransferase
MAQKHLTQGWSRVNDKSFSEEIHVVGAGLAGSECAFQLAERGHRVVLHEMRGVRTTPAHKTNLFAELVCSNSLGSETDYSAPGQLKWEAERLRSLILKSASEARIPAGMALGVDREVFARAITATLEGHPNIEIRRQVVGRLEDLPRPLVVATGPLTDDGLAESLRQHLAEATDAHNGDFLFFFDAIAPIVSADSIDMEVCYRANRFDDAPGDYINCPLNKEQYLHLVGEIKAARKVEGKDFEKTPYFESCMPVEAIVERGDQTLRYGPMSGKGLRDPRTGREPYAVVQLRQENLSATAYNMVGFQTKMAYGEQKRVFSQIPGLQNADFLKLGSIHRNMYIHSPQKLTPILSSRTDPWLFFAGQITGVEGYFESTCIGLLVALFLDRQILSRPHGLPPHVLPPRTTAFGSILNALTEPKKHFQPTNINFGLFPPLGDSAAEPGALRKASRDEKRRMQLDRARADFAAWAGSLS